MKTTFKKTLIRVTVILLVILVGCTFLSKSVYRANLPRVRTARASIQSELSVSVKTEGIITRETEEMTMPAGAKITAVLKEEGNRVDAGDPVFEVDAREFLLEIQRREMNIAALENALDSWMTEFNREQTEAQLEMARTELEMYKESVPWEGVVCADAAGTILQMNGEVGDTLPAGAVYCTVMKEEAPWEAEFVLTEEEARGYKEGCEVQLTYYAVMLEGDGTESKQRTANTAISSMKYENGYVVFRAPFEETNGLQIGQSVSVTAVLSSRVYPCVVPLAAVYEDAGGSHYLYMVNTRDGLFGEEQYAEKVTVEVLEENSFYAALDQGMFAGRDIIVSATRALEDGKVVVTE